MTIRKQKGFRQVRAAVSVIPYVLCGVGGNIQLSLSSGSFGSDPFTHCLSILSIAFPLGSGKRLNALSMNVAPDEGRRPASGACPLGRVLRRGPGLSSPGVLLEGLRDAPGSLSGFEHRLGSFLCVARDRRHSSPCLSDLMGHASGGGHPTTYRQTTRRDPSREAPSVPVAVSSESSLPRNHVVLRGRRAAHRPRSAAVGRAH
jgi:hypothetical protein